MNQIDIEKINSFLENKNWIDKNKKIIQFFALQQYYFQGVGVVIIDGIGNKVSLIYAPIYQMKTGIPKILKNLVSNYNPKYELLIIIRKEEDYLYKISRYNS